MSVIMCQNPKGVQQSWRICDRFARGVTCQWGRSIPLRSGENCQHRSRLLQGEGDGGVVSAMKLYNRHLYLFWMAERHLYGSSSE